MGTSRIAIVGMPTMLRQLVRETVAELPDVELVAELPEWDLHAAARVGSAAAADLYLVAAEQAGADDVAELLYAGRRPKVLAVSSDGRRAFLYELRPHRRPLGELSPAGLIAVIRQSAQRGTS